MEERLVSALRILSTDAINKAKSGHPGICLGAAPIVNALFTKVMNYTPSKKDWLNRDRFILSAGHGAPLLYSALHYAGYDISMEDMKSLRQLKSLTAGHPECDLVKGIDASTGPLGQGVAMGVGMAMAERYYAGLFNKDDVTLFDNYTYVLCGDGCLQEGVAQEALSFCGHQKLDKFILLYDSNNIQLDGPTNLAISEDVKMKYEAMGFNYILVEDGNSTDAIYEAILKAKAQNLKPSFIEVRTEIGYGTTLEGNCSVHGSPIGEENSNLLREKFGWDYEPFKVPSDIYDSYKEAIINHGEKKLAIWNQNLKYYEETYPEEYNTLCKFMNKSFELPAAPTYEEGYKEPSRKTGGVIVKLFQEHCLNILGGSADLTKSTQAKGVDGDSTKENPTGRNICYGVREHAMGAITNGLVLYGGLRAFTGAFFVFSDYMKPAIRMASLMHIPSVFIFTHDSIMVGEDGPTHEPIEQLEGLRAMPNLNVIRPGDAREVYEAYKIAFESKETPTVIVLSRQNLVVTKTDTEKVSLGAYAVLEEANPDYILLATGSEVELAYNTALELKEAGHKVRVVSMPSEYLFLRQSEEYQKSLLSDRAKTIAIEMGATRGWYQFASKVIGIDRYGLSAPGKDLQEFFGFTVEKIKAQILN